MSEGKYRTVTFFKIILKIVLLELNCHKYEDTYLQATGWMDRSQG
jgi:hypothetical protein